MTQLKLPGWEVVEKQWEAERVVTAKKYHEEWAASILRSMVEGYPPTAEECEIMLSGIRIDRFVSHLECEKCNYACEDHTIGSMFTYWSDTWHQYIPIKFCLKDYHRKRKRLGLGE